MRRNSLFTKTIQNTKRACRLKMAKSKNSKDKNKVALQELQHFKKLIKGHEKILKAIGKL